MSSHAEIFDAIYRGNVWGSGSGAGSREEVTRGYRSYLHSFLRSNRIGSVVDLGCGDWQIARHMDWTGIDYTGVDVSSVALDSARQFARPGVRFLHANALTDALPPADLLIAKDVLQHWSNDDILAFLPKLRNYRAALIINGFPEALMNNLNQNIATGPYHRPVDLGQTPFNLPGWFVFGFQTEEPKFIYLWTRPAS
ncbi:MAG TPA: class I SAM-dependent methyltransferase [Rhizomicrobium sp.]|nr:class I SAM-dependent methyltransferase [Rhizomicrobium sp.]